MTAYYKVVRRVFGQDHEYESLSAPPLWIRSYALGRRTVAAKPTGILVFWSIAHARDYRAGHTQVRRIAILKGTAGPEVPLPATCTFDASHVKELWERSYDGGGLWPEGTAAVRWFRPEKEVR